MCSVNVVSQFARVAHATNFLYCYSIIESNKRTEGRGSPGSNHRYTGLPSGDADLHSFFPFDPYNLPRSNIYVQGVYREWSSVAIEEEEEDDDEAEEEAEEGDSEADAEGGPKRVRTGLSSPKVEEDGTEGLGESFGGMSISPMRSVVVT